MDFKKIFSILRFYKKDNISFLIFLMVMTSILEVIGVGLVIPFITLILDPNLLKNLKIEALSNLEINQNNLIFFFITFFIILFFLFKNYFVLFVIKKQTALVMDLMSRLRYSLFEKYIYDDYKNFVKQDHSKLIANISNVVANFSSTFLNNFLIFASELLILIALTTFMFVYNFHLTITLMIVFGIIIYLYLKTISPKLKKTGLERINGEQNVIKYCRIGFQNFKEIKIFGKENFVLNLFNESAKKSETSNYFYNISAQFPRLGMEIFAIFSMCLIILIMLYSGYSNKDIIATLAFYGAAVFRILPSANKLMFSFQSVKFSKGTLSILNDELLLNTKDIRNYSEDLDKKIDFDNSIILSNVSFAYDERNKVLENINLEIKKGTFVGISGESGSGKSTLLDILLGLLEPNSGEIKIDKNNLINNKRKWQNICSYVPQNLFFLNDSIKNNVAFGIEQNHIDEKKIWYCLKKTKIDEYVKSLEDNINYVIGENGCNLSGGQRQRLGIARALYNDPKVLFFDESTSALDAKTEIEIINEIFELKKEVTIVFVSHNKNLFEKCDTILNVKNKTIEYQK